MRNPRTSTSFARFLGALVAAAALTLALGAGGASAEGPFGIESFDGEVIANSGGDAATQAGSHPYEATAEFDVNSHLEFGFVPVPNQAFKRVQVSLPAGFVGNPQALEKCSLSEFFAGGLGEPGCAKNTVVGTTVLKNIFAPSFLRVYNLAPGPNEPARFGYSFLSAFVVLHASIRTGGDYGTTITIADSPQGLPISGTSLSFWGVPGDPSHNAQRGEPFPGTVRPFLSNPTSCTGPVLTTLLLNSWQEPNNYQEANFLSHNSANEPVGLGGCDKLSFEPGLSLQSQPPRAASPAELSVMLHVRQHNDDPNGLITSHLKKAIVKLPAGVAVNPAAASGLSACTEKQFGLHASEPAHCANASKIGTVKIVTPLLEEPLQGALYLAEQNGNPFGSLLASYLVAERHGVIFKQATRLDLNQSTGQITASFDGIPQLPFSDVELRFFGGPRGVLVNPAICGDHAFSSTLTSWSGRTVNTSSSFAADQNCAKGGFDPSLSAGTTSPVAGAYAPFAFNVNRTDGAQNVAAIGASLPQGELGKLAGVPLCPEPNAAVGNCPAGSRIGRLDVAVGAGPQPLWVPQPGRAPTAMYLAGPYKGDPYSVVFSVPAQAGPFDLGTVAVRAAVHIDPITAQVSVSSDPLPQILQGVPIDYRQIRVDVDRPGFMLNPTNCRETAVGSTIVSETGVAVTPASRFQVGDCGNLGFKPRFQTRLFGGTKRGAHPRLRAVLKARPGHANVGRVALTLPRSELFDQRHVKSVCTRARFVAHACPRASIYGSARAYSPLLDRPLEGPVYLRSSKQRLPNLAADLYGQVDIELSGRIDSIRGNIRTTFATVPDAPLSTFVLNMKGGKRGLLVNSTDICHGEHRAKVRLTGHNGKRRDIRPRIRANCRSKRRH